MTKATWKFPESPVSRHDEATRVRCDRCVLAGAPQHAVQLARRVASRAAVSGPRAHGAQHAPRTGGTCFAASPRATYSQHPQSRRDRGRAEVLAPQDPEEAPRHSSVSALNQGTATHASHPRSSDPTSWTASTQNPCSSPSQATFLLATANVGPRKLKTVTFVYSLVQCIASANDTPGSKTHSHGALSALSRPGPGPRAQFILGKWISVSY